MPSFGVGSKAQLETVHPRLRMVLEKAIEVVDFTVVEGHRGKDAQTAAVAKGLSKTPWPTSKHNHTPSLAADCVPYPIDWSDRPANIERYCVLAGVILACAHVLGVKVRWGGDWDRDGDTRDEGFRDRPHFELDEPV